MNILICIVQAFLLFAGMFFVASIKAFKDCSKIMKEEKINHEMNAFVVVCFSALYSFILCKSAILFLPGLFIYWLSFDIILNGFRNKDLLYVGRVAKIDRLFQSIAGKGNPGKIMLIAKIICIVISFFVFFYTRLS